MSDWISVKDKLPELGTRCIVIDDSQLIEIAVYRNDILGRRGNKDIRVTGFQDEQDEQPSQVYPTHWMLLPEPPTIMKVINNNETETDLRELVEKWGYTTPYGEYEDIDEREELISDLTALISKHHYPKEFIVFCNDNFYWDKALGYLPTTTLYQGMTFKTTDELLIYWKENNR